MRGPDRLARCCERHDDWSSLGAHLCLDFRSVASIDVSRQLAEVRALTEQVALSRTDALETAELIVRHRLLQYVGEATSVARLDPESHERRKRQNG